MKIIVCNDQFDQEAREMKLPWEKLEALNEFLDERRDSAYKNIEIDWDIPDPLRKAYAILGSRELRDAESQNLAIHLRPLQREIDVMRKGVSRDEMLMEALEEENHEVRLFDGHSINLIGRRWEGLTPSEGAAALADLMVSHKCDGIVYDLQYFERETYGVEMLREGKLRFPADCTVVIYTKYQPRELSVSPEELKRLIGNVRRLEYVHRLPARGRAMDRVVEIFREEELRRQEEELRRQRGKGG